ncbi:unnamed protein product [Cyprideis torosa]|uniref:Uncharacterized protein n=1 Tax=Cyprideis torosa TaxID=163714 RepID=A0A7R8WNH6_9CRUS|nr:unnamed protein product [Cyprideis torosa]CAG0900437.1 unnamed protein product [Cyprideis torosa]
MSVCSVHHWFASYGATSPVFLNEDKNSCNAGGGKDLREQWCDRPFPFSVPGGHNWNPPKGFPVTTTRHVTAFPMAPPACRVPVYDLRQGAHTGKLFSPRPNFHGHD